MSPVDFTLQECVCVYVCTGAAGGVGGGGGGLLRGCSPTSEPTIPPSVQYRARDRFEQQLRPHLYERGGRGRTQPPPPHPQTCSGGESHTKTMSRVRPGYQGNEQALSGGPGRRPCFPGGISAAPISQRKITHLQVIVRAPRNTLQAAPRPGWRSRAPPPQLAS